MSKPQSVRRLALSAADVAGTVIAWLAVAVLVAAIPALLFGAALVMIAGWQ